MNSIDFLDNAITSCLNDKADVAMILLNYHSQYQYSTKKLNEQITLDETAHVYNKDYHTNWVSLKEKQLAINSNTSWSFRNNKDHGSTQEPGDEGSNDVLINSYSLLACLPVPVNLSNPQFAQDVADLELALKSYLKVTEKLAIWAHLIIDEKTLLSIVREKSSTSCQSEDIKNLKIGDTLWNCYFWCDSARKKERFSAQNLSALLNRMGLIQFNEKINLSSAISPIAIYPPTDSHMNSPNCVSQSNSNALPKFKL